MDNGKKKKFTKQFKLDAIKLITEHGYSTSEAARNLGIHQNTLRRWKNEFEKEHHMVFPENVKNKELYRLRKENKRLRMDLEILKKAAVFFAKEPM